jgi:hypothetical protein
LHVFKSLSAVPIVIKIEAMVSAMIYVLSGWHGKEKQRGHGKHRGKQRPSFLQWRQVVNTIFL